MRSLVEAGVVRPAQDERIRTAFLLANDLSLVLLRRQIARVTGTDPLTREGLASWTAAVMDVYTGGVFAAPAAAGGARIWPAAGEGGQVPVTAAIETSRPVQELRADPCRHRPGPGG